MTLYNASVTQEDWSGKNKDAATLMRGIAYAGTAQCAARMAGDKTTKVVPAEIKGFAQRHVESPIVERALNGYQSPHIVVADLGGTEAMYRWARTNLTPATRVAIEHDDLLDAELAQEREKRGSLTPLVVITRQHQTRTMREEVDMSAGLVPIGVFGTKYGTTSIPTNARPILLPPVFASTKKAKHSRHKRKRVESDDEPMGEDLMDGASADELESLDAYDDADGFIVSDNHVDTDDDISSDDDFSVLNTQTEETRASPSESDIVTDEDEALESVGEKVINVVDAAAGPPSPLELKHPVPEFDGKAQLYETGRLRLADGTEMDANHTYVVDGAIGYTSTTTLISQWLEPFDPIVVSLRMVASPKWACDTEYKDPAECWATDELRTSWKNSTYAGDVAQWPLRLSTAANLFVQGSIGWDTMYAMLTDATSGYMTTHTCSIAEQLQTQWKALCAQHIRDSWTHRSELGTNMHERIEHYFEGLVPRSTLERIGTTENEPELLQFLRWVDEWMLRRDYEPFRMELRVFDPAMRICGSIDALFKHKHTGQLIMVDWKRAKKISREGYNNRTGKGPMAGMPDCNFSKYTMQQNMYKYMIETHSSLRLSAMYLLICHPDQGEAFQLIDIPEMPKEVEGIRAERIREAM